MMIAPLVGQALVILGLAVGLAFVLLAGFFLVLLWFSLRSERDG